MLRLSRVKPFDQLIKSDNQQYSLIFIWFPAVYKRKFSDGLVHKFAC